jgi:putative SOS response-associated peptidase YedK
MSHFITVKCVEDIKDCHDRLLMIIVTEWNLEQD